MERDIDNVHIFTGWIPTGSYLRLHFWVWASDCYRHLTLIIPCTHLLKIYYSETIIGFIMTFDNIAAITIQLIWCFER